MTFLLKNWRQLPDFFLLLFPLYCYLHTILNYYFFSLFDQILKCFLYCFVFNYSAKDFLLILINWFKDSKIDYQIIQIICQYSKEELHKIDLNFWMILKLLELHLTAYLIFVLAHWNSYSLSLFMIIKEFSFPWI